MTTETKEPIALVAKGRDPEQVVAWACGTCGYVKRTEREARTCCPKRCATPGCGAVLEQRYHSRCPSCEKRLDEERAQEWAQERAEKMAALYAKAEKVPLNKYDGPLYWEDSTGGDWGDGYFSGVDALLRCYERAGAEPPPWVWACSPKRLAIHARDLVDRECEEQEMHEDAAGGLGDDALEELQGYLDVWCARYSPTSYEPDESIAVDISVEVAAWKTGMIHLWECLGNRLKGSVETPSEPADGIVCPHCAGFEGIHTAPEGGKEGAQ